MEGAALSAADAYLKPAMKRGNVRLVTGALVDCILFEGTRAVGVSYLRGGPSRGSRGGRACAVGGGDQLARHPAAVGNRPGAVLQSPVSMPAARDGVGANLQDHLEVISRSAWPQPITLYGLAGRPASAPMAVLQDRAGGFQPVRDAWVRSAEGVSYPDIQYHFLPVAISYDGRAPALGMAQLRRPMRSNRGACPYP